MIKRQAQSEIAQLLEEFPAVGVLGPRQIGKTTLAETIAASEKPEPVYLDLERPSEAARLKEPEDYFELHKGKLIILDEIQRVPELFQILRGVIDPPEGRTAHWSVPYSGFRIARSIETII